MAANNNDHSRDANNDAKTRNWCFTLNNPTDEERQFFASFEEQLPRGVAFLIYQEERGEQGTIHFQGYLELKQNSKKNWLINNFNNRASYRARRGTQQQAIAYCCKDDTRVPDGMAGRFGEPRGATAEEAKERRIQALDKIRKGELRLRDVESDLLLNTGFTQAAKLVLSTMLGPQRQVEVITIIGGTGIGKSWACYHYCGSDLITYQRNGWFGGADTQGTNLLFDEFTGGVPFDDFLKLLDGYPMQLPVKGSFYPAHYTRVFITSNILPELWWTAKGMESEELERKRKGHREALYRRIGYTGPEGQYPQFENGHFIYIDDSLPVQTARRILRQRLLMLGIDLEDHQEDNQEPQQEEEEIVVQEPLSAHHPEEEPQEPPRQVPRLTDQLNEMFAQPLDEHEYDDIMLP